MNRAAAFLLATLLAAGPAAAAPAPERDAPVWSVAVYEQASAQVVSISCGKEEGTGFFFHSPGLVATAYHVIESGRSVRVTTAGGVRHDADVVAWSSEDDLAILRLRTPAAGAAPLPAGSSAALRIGQPALALGFPEPFSVRALHDSEAPVVVASRGIVTARSDRAIQTDAAVSPGSSGGPLLDERGRVLGVMVRKLDAGLGFATPVERLEALAGSIGRQGTFFGAFAPSGAIGYMVSAAPEGSIDGFALGLGLRAMDRFELLARFGFLSGWAAPETGPLVHQRRSLIEAGLSYRFSVFGPGLDLHFPVGLGVAFGWDTTTEHETSLRFEDPGCDVAVESCQVITTRTATERGASFVLPMVTLAWEISIFEIATAVYIDPKGDYTTFRAVFGLHF